MAHPGFHDQCEIPERIDLKEASAITFDNVECKNLAATTGDAGMLVKNASSHLGVFRDLLIHATMMVIALHSFPRRLQNIGGLCLKLHVMYVDQ